MRPGRCVAVETNGNDKESMNFVKLLTTGRFCSDASLQSSGAHAACICLLLEIFEQCARPIWVPKMAEAELVTLEGIWPCFVDRSPMAGREADTEVFPG